MDDDGRGQEVEDAISRFTLAPSFSEIETRPLPLESILPHFIVQSNNCG